MSRRLVATLHPPCVFSPKNLFCQQMVGLSFVLFSGLYVDGVSWTFSHPLSMSISIPQCMQHWGLRQCKPSVSIQNMSHNSLNPVMTAVLSKLLLCYRVVLISSHSATTQAAFVMQISLFPWWLIANLVCCMVPGDLYVWEDRLPGTQTAVMMQISLFSWLIYADLM